MKILLFLLLAISFNCSDQGKDYKVDSYSLSNSITLFHLKCGDESYFTTDKCDCNNISKSNLKIIGDNENYFVINARYNKKLDKVEFYSYFNDVIKSGQINNTIEVFEYKNYLDNIFYNDSIAGNPFFLTINGTTSNNK